MCDAHGSQQSLSMFGIIYFLYNSCPWCDGPETAARGQQVKQMIFTRGRDFKYIGGSALAKTAELVFKGGSEQQMIFREVSITLWKAFQSAAEQLVYAMQSVSMLPIVIGHNYYIHAGWVIFQCFLINCYDDMVCSCSPGRRIFTPD